MKPQFIFLALLGAFAFVSSSSCAPPTTTSSPALAVLQKIASIDQNGKTLVELYDLVGILIDKEKRWSPKEPKINSFSGEPIYTGPKSKTHCSSLGGSIAVLLGAPLVHTHKSLWSPIYLASKMFSWLDQYGEKNGWIRVGVGMAGEIPAQNYANQGYFVVAVKKGTGHLDQSDPVIYNESGIPQKIRPADEVKKNKEKPGHITIVRPHMVQDIQKTGPQVMNVGHINNGNAPITEVTYKSERPEFNYWAYMPTPEAIASAKQIVSHGLKDEESPCHKNKCVLVKQALKNDPNLIKKLGPKIEGELPVQGRRGVSDLKMGEKKVIEK